MFLCVAVSRYRKCSNVNFQVQVLESIIIVAKSRRCAWEGDDEVSLLWPAAVPGVPPTFHLHIRTRGSAKLCIQFTEYRYTLGWFDKDDQVMLNKKNCLCIFVRELLSWRRCNVIYQIIIDKKKLKMFRKKENKFKFLSFGFEFISLSSQEHIWNYTFSKC